MPAVRRLAAILAADVAGYSRLMGVDEEGTHEHLRKHFGQLVEPKIREHKGCTVKNIGDGLLAEFASVVDAVRCAAEVQLGMVLVSVPRLPAPVRRGQTIPTLQKVAWSFEPVGKGLYVSTNAFGTTSKHRLLDC